MNSNREFMIQVSEEGLTNQHHLNINQLMIALKKDDCPELYYAVDERLDKVLDLKVKESMYFQPNRDNKNSKGIITRIQ